MTHTFLFPTPHLDFNVDALQRGIAQTGWRALLQTNRIAAAYGAGTQANLERQEAI